MNLEATLQREEGIVARRIAGETILVPITRRAQEMGLFTLNEVGTFVWERLDGGTPLAAIASELTEAFEVDAGRAREDLLDFGERLTEAGCARDTAQAVRTARTDGEGGA